jgi:uncharacterized protein (TIGR02147 family)
MLLVMKGKRNLSSEICFKLSTLFKHTQQEAAYFLNMVYFSQSKNYREKDQYWDKMVTLRQKTRFGKILEYQYDYYNNWYTIPIRECIPYMHKPLDYKLLARMISPPITAAQARQSVKLLVKLGMVEETDTGYIKTDAVIRTEPKVNSLAVHNFHANMGKLAMEKLENCTQKERNFSSCTMNISGACYHKIIERINEFSQEIMSLCEQDTGGERVYHLNFQFFPVTGKIVKESGQ